MIHSTSNIHGFTRMDAAGNLPSKAATPQAHSHESSERLSSANTQSLREALNKTPEIRPEVVDKGKELAVDPNYPPRELIERLAELMNNSREPAE